MTGSPAQVNILFIISSDPRCSPRPAEAIRIAAGLSVSKRLEVSVYLRDHALLALAEGAEELVDGDNFIRYLTLLREAGHSVYTPRGGALKANLPESAGRPIDEVELSRLASQCQCLLRF